MTCSFLSPDLSKRSEELEWLDLPTSDEAKLFRTLEQMVLINRLFSRSRYLLKTLLVSDMHKRGKKTYDLLDVGAGGCDIDLWLVRYCRRQGIHLQVTCLELDERIIRFAKEKIKNEPCIRIVHRSAFELREEQASYDYVFTNHFLHHLPDERIPEMIDLIAGASRLGFLMNDLGRSHFSYWGFSLFAALFLRRSFNFHDGRLSIRKGFSPNEIRQLVAKGKSPHKDHFKVGTLFPGRVFLYYSWS